jgi:adenylate cyclase
MTRPVDTSIMDLPSNATEDQAIASLLPPLEHQRAVLVVDLVESVRLMSLNEAAVVGQWHGFVQHVQDVLLPARGGKLIKSLGDGLLTAFDDVTQAVQAVLVMHRFFDQYNKRVESQERLHLRAGIHLTHLYRDQHDIYGQGVNLAARIADLGEPGDTVITAQVHERLIDGVDADLEDMGESHLKHVAEPVRTWRLFPASQQSHHWRAERPEPAPLDWRPSIAVIPFQARNQTPEHFVVGEIIADGVITHLSRSSSLRVISRLSTTSFRQRPTDLDGIQSHLASDFVIGGSYTVVDDRVIITAELSSARQQEVIWADRTAGPLADLMALDSQLVGQMSDAASLALINDTVQRATVLPVPKLVSNALLLGSVALMHRSTARDLERSRELLTAVTERHRRVATPWAWMAKWHILNIVQGRSADAPSEFRQAIDIADRALDLEPESSLALAIKGHVQCHLGTDLDASRRLLIQATEVNPNDSNAWLYAGFWSTMWGNAKEAVVESERALALSPLDPHRFFIEMLVAHSYLQANDLPKTIEMCQRSLRRNSCYLATLRVLMTAQFESGQIVAAKRTASQLLALQPGLTVSKFLSYGSSSSIRQRAASAMRGLGVPP